MRIVSGYWRKIYACSIDRFVYQLREGTWTFTDSIRFSQPGCETIGGTSGSPIIHATTGAIIGINSTGNESGGRCASTTPARWTSTATPSLKRRKLRPGAHQIYSCLDADNEIDLDRPGCLLNSRGNQRARERLGSSDPAQAVIGRRPRGPAGSQNVAAVEHRVPAAHVGAAGSSAGGTAATRCTGTGRRLPAPSRRRPSNDTAAALGPRLAPPLLCGARWLATGSWSCANLRSQPHELFDQTSAGASRMSSVSGLNDRPHTATVLP